MTLFLLLLIFFFTSCNETRKKTAEGVSKPNQDTQISENKTTTKIADSVNNSSTSQIEDLIYGITKVSDEIELAGDIVAMVKWKDKLGLNMLLVTETAEVYSADVRSKELYAYHYIEDGAGQKLLWKVYDYIKDCPVDVTLDYLDKSLTISDLDNDGIGESSFLYKLSCKGDVSSDDLKLIMHEGEKKFALRGSTTLLLNGKTYQEGSMKPDAAFNGAPDEFLEFASSQWKKFETEKLGE